MDEPLYIKRNDTPRSNVPSSHAGEISCVFQEHFSGNGYQVHTDVWGDQVEVITRDNTNGRSVTAHIGQPTALGVYAAIGERAQDLYSSVPVVARNVEALLNARPAYQQPIIDRGA